jgi:putative spermidine/putrescine transport system substrate-binding protein
VTVQNDRRRRIRTVAAGLTLTLPLLAACSGGDEEPAVIGESFDEIVELAQEEGRVHLIAYPDDWANYAESFERFTEKFGVDVDVSSPDASSAEELEVVRTLGGQANLPDVLDIGSSFTQTPIDEELVAPYFPTTIDDVPDALKDPDGHWTSAYYGVLSIGVNADEVDVPTSFADLLDEQYRGRINLGGDPRDGAIQFAVVVAAALANGGSLDDIEPGIEFFETLASEGYLVSTGTSSASLSTGEAAVTFDWNYNYFGFREEVESAGVNLEVDVPVDGVFGDFYAQPITAQAPQPNAARLWVEWLLSDEGAAVYAASGAVPARYEAIVESGDAPAGIFDGLPPAETLAEIEFLDLDQRAAATALIVEQWGERVASR